MVQWVWLKRHGRRGAVIGAVVAVLLTALLVTQAARPATTRASVLQATADTNEATADTGNTQATAADDQATTATDQSTAATGATAQPTETAVGGDVPPPTDCRITPRPLPANFAAVTATTTPSAAGSPTPSAPPAGQPADRATVAAVTATVRESIACTNAQDYLREFALVTNRYFEKVFTGPNALNRAAFASLVATPPAAAAPEDQTHLLGVRDVRLLPDGRARAVVSFVNPDGRHDDLLVFAKQGDRWLIDDFITQATKATATAT